MIDSKGMLYVGGDFSCAGGRTVLPTGGVLYILKLDRKDIQYAGGAFDTAGGVPVNNIARCNGTT